MDQDGRARLLESLRPVLLPQLFGRDRGQHAIDACHHVINSSYELLGRNRADLVELELTSSDVRFIAEAAQDPLARVATQMQDEVADTHRLLVGPKPDLFFREYAQASLESGNGFSEKTATDFLEQLRAELLTRVRHDGLLASISFELRP